jgi:predicted RNA-binding Zn ribbon-like protein
VTAATWTADDLPLLGEPAPVELANSLYGEGDERIDFLGTPELTRLWLDHVAFGVAFPLRLSHADAGRLRGLRDAIRRLVDGTVDGLPPAPEAVEVVNGAARLAPRSPQLVAGPGPGSDDGVAWVSPARGVDAALGALAHDAVALLGGPDGARLRRCAAPDCGMAFVQQHGRRRWCHDSCGHRMRQAAYHRRRTGRPGPTPSPLETT